MRMNIECLKNVHQKRWIGCGGRTSQTLSPAKQLFNSWKHFFKIVPSLWKLSWGHTAYNKWRNIHSRKYTESRQEHWGSAPLPTPFPSHWLPYPDRAGPRRWVGSSPSLPSSCRGADCWHFFCLSQPHVEGALLQGCKAERSRSCFPYPDTRSVGWSSLPSVLDLDMHVIFTGICICQNPWVSLYTTSIF